jgi:two-component system, chemotaxis family, chemotaxis protein CheY
MGVLVVDDTDAIREIVVELLSDEGYRTAGAPHGKAALAYLASGPWLPRLILLDLMMPVMNGWQFAQALRAHSVYVSIPIILMSAGANVHEARRALNVVGAVPKPLDFDHLCALVRQCLGPP